MDLRVQVPPGYPEERRWVIDVVLGRFLGLSHRIEAADRDDVRITRAGDAEGAALLMPDLLFRTPEPEWLTAAALPRSPLRWWDARADVPEGAPSAPMPLLYAEDAAGGAYLEALEAGTRLRVDVFGSAFVLLSRYEELLPGPRDPHGRFPASQSLAHREGFLDRPVVNEYVNILYALMARLWPGLRRKRWSYSVRLSHDVDFPLVTRGRTPAQALRRAAGDVALRRSPTLALRTLRSWRLTRRGTFHRDPAYTFDFLMTTSETRGLRSSFFFMAGLSGHGLDGDYTLADPWITQLLRRVHERGHVIGLHPGYGAAVDPEQIRREFTSLLTAAERQGVRQDTWGGRQHFLRWENPVTWQGWNDAGLDYDSTLGFADHAGFRCGVCYPYPVFNLVARRPLTLEERPLQVMDTSLIDYMRLSPRQRLEHATALAVTTRRHGGELHLLWHNTNLLSRAQKNHYVELIDSITA